MDEREFIDSIDCRFPYTDTAAALRLIVQACSISPNAAFAVLYELVLPPRNVAISKEQRHLLLSKLESLLDHPLKSLVIGCARKAINGEPIKEADAIDAMQQVAQFVNQYGALSVIYTCFGDDSDVIETLYDEIVRGWQNNP